MQTKEVIEKKRAKELAELSAKHLEFCERSQLIDWFRERNVREMKSLRKAYDISQTQLK